MFKHKVEIMSEAFLDIKRWGNNLGVRLPAAVAKAAKLRVNQAVQISVENGRVIITPRTDNRLSLADRLAKFDPAAHGGEVMITTQRGAETW